MTNTITAVSTSETTTPVVVNGYETARQSRNLVYDLLAGGIYVVLVSPRPRNGVLRLVYENETDAYEAVQLHTLETQFTLESDERTSVNMTYVVDGQISAELDPETLTVWIVTVGYQEVDA